MVRIIAMINRIDPSVKTYCQFYYEEGNKQLTSEVFEYLMIWKQQWMMFDENGYLPYLISCKNPITDIPTSVSLVERKCDEPTNNLKVIFNQPENELRKPFAVCAKHLIFDEDITTRLIEWIEIVSILGATKIYFYVVRVHPNIMKALKYYESKGIVEIEFIVDLELSNDRSKEKYHKILSQMVAVNDCFLKHMHEYEIISIFDTDELIMPTIDETWKDLLARNSYNDDLPPALTFTNLYFFIGDNSADETKLEIPEDFFFLRHIYRAQNHSRKGLAMKAFFNPQKVLVICNHFPLVCIKKGVSSRKDCKVEFISTEFGRLQHYRSKVHLGCNKEYTKEECEDFENNQIKDLTLWKYKNEIVENVSNVKKIIGMRSVKSIKSTFTIHAFEDFI
ncbi:CLUMA_CG007899, isoform A [Clunio marinus]|uniref:Glycosyltransferase family 92 protein n=1 Tax=Clunio marinus TaxID=568069 RepID=A0A1J1I245_9DIPT|nr:CLUMA_CG007899, isoform A [Clunio marinus]